MPHCFKLARRLSRLRAGSRSMMIVGSMVCMTTGCNQDDPVAPEDIQGERVTEVQQGDSSITAAATSCSGTATVICPGDNAQAKAKAAGPGATLTFKAGVHRFAKIDALNNQVFRGEPGAVLTGAQVLTGFVWSGNLWAVGGQTQQNTAFKARTCESGHPGCNLPEQLWIDDVLQERMTSRAAVVPGKWYFDYGTNTVYIAADPRDRVVETSVTPYAFAGSGASVRIAGLKVNKYATGAGHGTIEVKTGWVVDSSDIGQNHGTCIRMTGGNTKVRWNRIHDCGQSGIGGPAGRNILVEGNEIAFNHTAWFGRGNGDAAFGGAKWSGTIDMVIRGNYVHDNRGTGLWCDVGCENWTVERNTVVGNHHRGIDYEISYGCTIAHNTVENNATRLTGPSAAGIWIAQSPDCEVANNTLRDNANGIIGTDRDRGSGRLGPYLLKNLSVHDNTVIQRSGLAGGVQDQHPGHDPYSAASNNRWRSNSYTGSVSPVWMWTGNRTLSKAQWQAAGQDTGGSATTQ